ncbi:MULTISPECIES: transporter suffix domain-containing protein [Pseudomonas]|uniref:Transporter suffix domain-containing protein n=1 Tax=Pseudomonas piscis TaxID=2614538 RepID=U6ZRV7_9PSED|nr:MULTISPECIES: transporter suffix domain-containing protein [Pseudomonas]AZC18341.1 Acriflavin resistance plasma membrane protein [Pseudomonas sp. CMR5c]ERO60094.1 hypothetical protein P308_15500 [Pseudomonas piscis]MQA54399.1 transporter suffix domain-containing protein [Pseudomonas piscis]POA52578.1 hypothetical protein C1889_22390 [Pseudomonas sp. FW507-12TSA]WMN20663.1 transporter suffix domain-containing protein [Pseudomonas piscis]
MKEKTTGLRKKIGLSLLALVLLYWIALPILPFLEIPHKALVIPSLALFGELLTLVVMAILGKEYWGQLKLGARRLLRRHEKQPPTTDDKQTP